MDGWMDGWMDGQIFGWIAGCSDKEKYILLPRKLFFFNQSFEPDCNPPTFV